MVCDEVFDAEHKEEFEKVKNEVVFHNVVFKGMDLRDANNRMFEGCTFISCWFRNMSNTIMSDCVVRGGKIGRSGNLPGLVAHSFTMFNTDFYDFDFRNAEMTAMSLNGGSFNRCYIEGMKLEGSISDTDFVDLKGYANLDNVVFESADSIDDEFLDRRRSALWEKVNKAVECWDKFTYKDSETGKVVVDQEKILKHIGLESEKFNQFLSSALLKNTDILNSLTSDDPEKTKENISSFLNEKKVEYVNGLVKEIHDNFKFVMRYNSVNARKEYVEEQIKEMDEQESIRKLFVSSSKVRLDSDTQYAEQEAKVAIVQETREHFFATPEGREYLALADKSADLEEFDRSFYKTLSEAKRKLEDRKRYFNSSKSYFLKVSSEEYKKRYKNKNMSYEETLRKAKADYEKESLLYQRAKSKVNSLQENYDKNRNSLLETLGQLEPYENVLNQKIEEALKARLYREEQGTSIVFNPGSGSVQAKEVTLPEREKQMKELIDARDDLNKSVTIFNKSERWTPAAARKIIEKQEHYQELLKAFKSEHHVVTDKSDADNQNAVDQNIVKFLVRVQSSVEDSVERVQKIKDFMSRIRTAQKELKELEHTLNDSHLFLDSGIPRSRMDNAFLALQNFDKRMKIKYGIQLLQSNLMDESLFGTLCDTMDFSKKGMDDTGNELKLFHGKAKDRKALEKKYKGFKDGYEEAYQHILALASEQDKKQEQLQDNFISFLSEEEKKERAALSSASSSSLTDYMFKNKQLLIYGELERRCEAKRSELSGIIRDFRNYDAVLANRFLEQMQNERNFHEAYEEKGIKKGYDGAHLNALNKKNQRERNDRNEQDTRDFTEYEHIRREKWKAVVDARNKFFAVAKRCKAEGSKNPEMVAKRKALREKWNALLSDYKKYKSLRDGLFTDNKVVTINYYKLDEKTGKTVKTKVNVHEKELFAKVHEENQWYLNETRSLESKISSMEKTLDDKAKKAVDPKLVLDYKRKNSEYESAKARYEENKDDGKASVVFNLRVKMEDAKRQLASSEKAYNKAFENAKQTVDVSLSEELAECRKQLSNLKTRYKNWSSRKDLRKYIALSDYHIQHAVDKKMAQEEVSQKMGRAVSGVLDYSGNSEQFGWEPVTFSKNASNQVAVSAGNVKNAAGVPFNLDFEYRFYMRSSGLSNDTTQLFPLLDELDAGKDTILKERGKLCDAFIRRAVPEFTRECESENRSGDGKTDGLIGVYRSDDKPGCYISVSVHSDSSNGDSYYCVSGRCGNDVVKRLREKSLQDKMFAGLAVYNGDARAKESHCYGVNDYGRVYPFEYRFYMTSSALANDTTKLFPLLDELEAKKGHVLLEERSQAADTCVETMLPSFKRTGPSGDRSSETLLSGVVGNFEDGKGGNLVVEACSDSKTKDTYYRMYGSCSKDDKDKMLKMAMHSPLFANLVVFEGDRLAKAQRVGVNDYSVSREVKNENEGCEVDFSDVGNKRPGNGKGSL